MSRRIAWSSLVVVAVAVSVACGTRPPPETSGWAKPPPGAIDAAPMTVAAPPPPDAAPAVVATPDAPPVAQPPAGDGEVEGGDIAIPKEKRNNPHKAPAANAKGCKADLEHCCMADDKIVWLNGCCGGALPAYCGKVGGYNGDRGADGRCEGCTRRCLPEAAMIATPTGDVAVSALVAGQLVWSASETGERIAVPIERIGSLPIEGDHELIVVHLDDGRTLRASPGHPIVGGARLDTVRLGDRLDGATVIGVAREPYRGAATWDLLPRGGSSYWADGVRIESTLRATAARR